MAGGGPVGGQEQELGRAGPLPRRGTSRFRGEAPIRIAREGYRFVFVASALAAAALAAGWLAAGVALAAAALALAGFFRDPERTAPDGDGVVVSPADGKVVEVSDEGRRLSIFLSPLDVHVNRAPMNGRVQDVRYRPGRFFAANRGKASDENERNVVEFVEDSGKTLQVVQIAGFLARRIVCDVGPGDPLRKGERFGLIMFGSRVDLRLPPGAAVEVRPGQRVRSGETVVARL